ncbi:hypothetical protein TNCV_4029891 [Trichonephila clavipes]|nr:hypothetical protein TNCV_4029891 [Trichonephila clavipes]
MTNQQRDPAIKGFGKLLYVDRGSIHYPHRTENDLEIFAFPPLEKEQLESYENVGGRKYTCLQYEYKILGLFLLLQFHHQPHFVQRDVEPLPRGVSREALCGSSLSMVHLLLLLLLREGLREEESANSSLLQKLKLSQFRQVMCQLS